MKHEVFWKNPGYKSRPELKEDIDCDYLIIGGGVTGVSLAYFLSHDKSKKIVLIEKRFIASGATGKAAGILTAKGELDLKDLIKNFGKKGAISYWKGNIESLDNIEHLIKKEKIECEYESLPTLYCDFNYPSYHNLMEEYKAEKEINDVKIIEGEELRKELNTPLFRRALVSPEKAVSVNPLKLTQNLSKVAEKRGVKIFENTGLEFIKDNYAFTNYAKIKFKKVIFSNDFGYHDSRIVPIKSTLIVTKVLSNKQLKETGLIKKKMVWDTKKDYEYFKVTKDNRILIGFGGIRTHKADHRHDPHFPHLDKLELFFKKLFPYTNIPIEYVWSGSYGSTNRWMPIVKLEKNKIVIVATGSQVISVMMAQHVAKKLSNKKSTLEDYFKNSN